MHTLRRPAAIPLVALSAVLSVVILRTAWMSDDAYITFRVIDNWVHGYGITWNIAERVQPYTHPLWMLLVAAVYRVSHEPYYTSIVLSLLLSTGTALLLALRVAATTTAGALAVLVLICSRAFVDYSTSGLENPLVHFLLAVFVAAWVGMARSPRRLLCLTLTASLLALTRTDALLLCLPTIGVEAWGLRARRPVGAMVLGSLPFVAWTLFALFYYGFPFPNSAYAKLGTGIARHDLVIQGLRYLLDSFRRDPVTPVTVAAGLCLAVLLRRDWIPIAAGVVLYLIYVVGIGGDFMSGRFLTAPLVASVAILSCHPLKPRARATSLVALLIVGLGFASPSPPLLSGPSHANGADHLIDAHGISDERGYYFQQTGLFRADGGRGVDRHPGALRGREARARDRVVLGGNIGFFGYYAGPTVHVIDGFALADPLLARLPIRSLRWRVGHYVRDLPPGYFESVNTGRNVIADARIREFYDRMNEITRGPLMSPGRLRTIWRMNTGGYRGLIEPFYQSRRLQNEGKRHWDAEHFEQAIPVLQQSVALDSSRASSWFLLSAALIKTRRLDEANAALTRAISLQPNRYEETLMELGGEYLSAGDPRKAVAVLEQYVAHRPDTPGAQALLGLAYEQVGAVERAAEHYPLALKPDAQELRKHLEAMRR